MSSHSFLFLERPIIHTIQSLPLPLPGGGSESWFNFFPISQTRTVLRMMPGASIYQLRGLMQLFHFLLLLLLPLATPLSFNFSSFDQNTTHGVLVYQGVAAANGGVIHLTKDQQEAVGKAVYFEPVPVWDSGSGKVADFTTHFSFVIDGFNQSMSGDGLAFFLQPFPTDVPLDSYGGTLGLFNGTADNITPNRIVAVEFDSFLNAKYNDTSSDHIGIDVHTVFSAASADLGTSIKQGLVANARISYNSSTKNLSVSLAYAPNPVVNGSWTLSHVVDLREVLPEEAAIGFSAATGNAIEAHSILSWDFSSSLGPTNKMARKKRRKGLIVGCAAGAIAGLCLVWIAYCCCCRKKKGGGEKAEEEEHMDLDAYVDNALIEKGGGPKKFSYRELVKATRNFAEERRLGRGGFGEVYKGVLQVHSKVEVAIKRVSRGSKQGKKEYLSEIKVISRLRHRNLVQLIGYCHEKENLLLVYEFLPNGSLDAHLYGEGKLLPWQQRYRVVTEIAAALLYLHEEWEQCIVHRDLKPSNVMLDSGLRVKLGDFGLARLLDHDQTSLTTVMAGTRGYMAPEYATTGKACKESDVYSFGVVALEVACGRRPIEHREEEIEKVNLVQWVWELHGRGECVAAADERLGMDFDEKHMERLMVVGLWCAHPDSVVRPTIRQAMAALNFESPLPNLPPLMPVPMYLPPSSTDASNFEQSSCSGCSSITNSAINGR